MRWEVEYTNEFEDWWSELNTEEQESIAEVVLLLRDFGPRLTRPYSDTVRGSRHQNMKELRIQHQGNPYRVLYAFDPRRMAILLLGGCKKGDDRWYERNIPIVDDLYDEHLREIEGEV